MAFAVCAAPGIAQQAPASAVPRSTTSGVYTPDQAARGRDTYVASCQGCHTAAGHSGPAFLNSWVGSTVADLFDYLQTAMPKSDPGSLTAKEYSVVVAYLLSLNGMPSGRDTLPADPNALRRIRIDTTTSGRP